MNITTQNPVRLPGDEWIWQQTVVNAITNASHPDRRRGKGASLITRKTMNEGHPIAGLKVLLSDAEMSLLKKVRGASRISATISETEWEGFLSRFKLQHPKQAAKWTPCRPTNQSLYAEYAAGAHVAETHLTALRAWVARGDIFARSGTLAPHRLVDAHTELQRSGVEKYLRTAGINYVIGEAAPPPLYAIQESPATPVSRSRRGAPAKWKGALLTRLVQLSQQEPALTHKQIGAALGENPGQVGKVLRALRKTDGKRLQVKMGKRPELAWPPRRDPAAGDEE